MMVDLEDLVVPFSKLPPCLLVSLAIGWVAPSLAEQKPPPKQEDAAPAFTVPEPPALTEAAKRLLDDVNKRIVNINTTQLHALLRDHPETVVIDVRTPAELALLGGRIEAPQFLNITRGWLEFQIESYIPSKTTPIVTYCGVSQRSPLAAETLIKLGYTNVKNYSDGFFKWRAAGLPILALDKTPDSFLYDLPRQVIPGVWSAIGATAPGTYENSGHNNNLSFIITEEGVLVMNAGDNYLLAQSLHEEIKKHTKQPVRYVVLENSQGHAMLGSGYWKEQGAKIVAQRDTASHIEKYGYEALAVMQARARDKAFKTEVALPDIIFDDKLDLKMGSWNIQVLHLGNAHHHGDTMVWLPEKKLVISGDTAFHVRMLPVFEDTDTKRWVEVWDRFEALGAEIVIPGHGGPTDMKTVRKWTRDYLVYLREKVAELIRQGGSLDDAYKIDQSAYLHLHTSEELAKINAGRIFRAMEFE
jgi:rhodanese-related sulfurtransferase/glyoxylase-like metal-dependent hydrolase (beta-lactamase superfamily II)